MKTIGLIGGLSWVSSLEYYRILNMKAHEHFGGMTSAPIILNSIEHQAYFDLAHCGKEDEAAQMLIDAAQGLERAGADFIAMACNNAHRFAGKITENITIDFLHIAQATAHSIQAKGYSKVALLGVRNTMEGDFYPDILKENGIETIRPSESQMTYIDGKIRSELVHETFLPKTRAGYIKIMHELCEQGAEGVILGCTEIPMLVHQDHTGVPLFSTTHIHCDAIFERCLARSF